MTANIINYCSLILFGLAIGFISAIPVGAVQIQVVRMALKGRRKSAIATALGSATSDLIYGIVTLFGIGKFLLLPRFELCFNVIGIMVLSFLLYHSIREYLNPASDRKNAREEHHNFAFFTGFTLSITNPSMMLWWIVGFRLFLDLNFFQEITIPLKGIFVLASCAGLLGYLLIISVVIHRIRRNITEKITHRLNLALVFMFFCLIIYFVYKLL